MISFSHAANPGLRANVSEKMVSNVIVTGPEIRLEHSRETKQMAGNGSSVQVDYLPRLPINKDTGIGCIGSGFIMADCHLEAYAQAGFNPVAIASRA